MPESSNPTLALPATTSRDVLTDILRAGAQQLLAQAIEAEMAEWIDTHQHVTNAAGHRQVVRNGHLPQRTILTGVGAVEVEQPRVLDRRRDEEAEVFSSKILPPCLLHFTSMSSIEAVGSFGAPRKAGRIDMSLQFFRGRVSSAICLAAWAAVGAASAARADIRTYETKLHKVNDRVYSATGYALANVLYVKTDNSVVVIDTTESPAAAKRSLDEFRRICDLPVSYIIYTHFHGDHVNGAQTFAADKPHIVAQQLHKSEIDRYRLLANYNLRLNAIQFAMTLPERDRGISLAPETLQAIRGYIQPDMTFDEQLRFEEGGVKFELYHSPGETNDQLAVWLPDQKTLFCGDLFYWSFPMLASPMKPDRPALVWAESLDRLRELEPEYLVPSHGEPIAGKEAIRDILTNYAAAIRFVHDRVVEGINRGQSLEEVRATVQLPDELAKLPYLRPEYGRVDWAINGIYRQYAGWYDMNPAHLNPDSTAKVNAALIEAAGRRGADSRPCPPRTGRAAVATGAGPHRRGPRRARARCNCARLTGHGPGETGPAGCQRCRAQHLPRRRKVSRKAEPTGQNQGRQGNRELANHDSES